VEHWIWKEKHGSCGVVEGKMIRFSGALDGCMNLPMDDYVEGGEKEKGTEEG
jgi:hypothetical protein